VGAAAAAILVGLLIHSVSQAPAPAASTTPSSVAETAAPSSEVSPSTPETTQRSGLAALWPRFRFTEAPAHVELRLEHSLKDGALTVYVDDEVVLQRDLGARVTRKILFYRARKETLSETLDVPPGEHTIRLQITSGDSSYTQRIKGAFKSGETRPLEASLGGLITKELELVWGASRE
jgi:hypothetical protein